MTHHRRGLRRLLRNDDLAARLEADYLTADLGERRVEMLRFAEKLTRTPAAMERSDVDRLRTAGFSDVDILNICDVTAYYAYANRIADGLGIPLEDWITDA